MATNDFVNDLVKKLDEDNIEYLVIAVQKGKEEHKANAYYSIKTIDGADVLATTVEEVFRVVGDDDFADGNFADDNFADRDLDEDTE